MKPVLHFRIICFVHTEFQIFESVLGKQLFLARAEGSKGSSTQLLLLVASIPSHPGGLREPL